MSQRFIIIDSFRVTEALRERLNGISLGTWFVLDGQFSDESALPGPMEAVTVHTPEGEAHRAEVAEARVSHGSAALRFKPDFESLPRLSTVHVEHEL